MRFLFLKFKKWGSILNDVESWLFFWQAVHTSPPASVESIAPEAYGGIGTS
jgi:hypothetical protein